MGQGLLFDVEGPHVGEAELKSPQGYRGLAAFHKYWGKKPVECFAFLINNLTTEQEIILDPFVGSGLLAREAIHRSRRFIGIDINPIAIELSKLMVNPPSQKELVQVIKRMEHEVRPEIEESYQRDNGEIATHLLWEGDKILSVWSLNGRQRQKRAPTRCDEELYARFSNYRSKHVRDIRFFTNSRINTSPSMTLGDLFTGRALRNIDIILRFAKEQPENVRKAILLILTAASGQMSKMVFAVTGRGKTKGKIEGGISIGSWVIGYWRPRLHFEVSVWNCFQNKARRLCSALAEIPSTCRSALSGRWADVIESRATVGLVLADARQVLAEMPARSVSLVLTDPPHSDRMPYLELSELWNALLGLEASFDREIVVSNARERCKDKRTYTTEMKEFLKGATRVLCDGGTMAILFNAGDSDSWEYLRAVQEAQDSLYFRGCFPMAYSAASVVQDNRAGALRYDYVLIYEKCSKSKPSLERWKGLTQLDQWSPSLPERGR